MVYGYDKLSWRLLVACRSAIFFSFGYFSVCSGFFFLVGSVLLCYCDSLLRLVLLTLFLSSGVVLLFVVFYIVRKAAVTVLVQHPSMPIYLTCPPPLFWCYCPPYLKWSLVAFRLQSKMFVGVDVVSLLGGCPNLLVLCCVFECCVA